MEGYYVVAFYQGNFYYRFVPVNSTTVYMDKEIGSYPGQEQALSALALLEQGYSLGWEAGYDLCKQERI
jgi:hypothetical protein